MEVGANLEGSFELREPRQLELPTEAEAESSVVERYKCPPAKKAGVAKYLHKPCCSTCETKTLLPPRDSNAGLKDLLDKVRINTCTGSLC